MSEPQKPVAWRISKPNCPTMYLTEDEDWAEFCASHGLIVEALAVTPQSGAEASRKFDREQFDKWWRTAEVSESYVETAWAAWQAALAAASPEPVTLARILDLVEQSKKMPSSLSTVEPIAMTPLQIAYVAGMLSQTLTAAADEQ